MVRGKEINFSARYLNEFFESRHVGKDEYSSLKKILSPEDIATVFCVNKEDAWENEVKHVFKPASFTREAKVGLLFVNATLLPTKNVSSDRALLIYCIIQGNSINIGRIICEQIQSKSTAEKGQQLWYPTLITKLCRHMGVRMGDGDLVTTVAHHITQNVVTTNIKVLEEPTPTQNEKWEPL